MKIDISKKLTILTPFETIEEQIRKFEKETVEVSISNLRQFLNEILKPFEDIIKFDIFHGNTNFLVYLYILNEDKTKTTQTKVVEILTIKQTVNTSSEANIYTSHEGEV